MNFNEQVKEVKEVPEYTLKDVYEFIKSVYEYVIPENKEVGEHGFNVLDCYEMESIGAWLLDQHSQNAAMNERIAKLERLLRKSKMKIMQLHDEIMIDNEIKCIGEKCTEVIFCQEIDEALK